MHHDVKMTHDTADQGGRFLVGVICGAAVGAAVALLFAPRSGADLRGQIVDGAQRVGRQAADASNRASSTINEMVSRGRRLRSVVGKPRTTSWSGAVMRLSAAVRRSRTFAPTLRAPASTVNRRVRRRRRMPGRRISVLPPRKGLPASRFVRPVVRRRRIEFPPMDVTFGDLVAGL